MDIEELKAQLKELQLKHMSEPDKAKAKVLEILIESFEKSLQENQEDIEEESSEESE